MDINANVPAKLQEAWGKVSADGKIDANEYKYLLDSSAPNKLDSELTEEDVSFLSEIKDKLQSSGGEFKLKEGKAEPQMNLFDEQPVPDSLKGVWNKANADGKITVEEFNELLKTAAPNGKNSEFSENEVQFLSKVKNNIQEQNEQSNTTQKTETIIKNIITAKNNPSEIVKNVDNFEKTLQNMNNKELANVAKVLAKMISETDGNDKVLVELQQIVLSKIN